MLKKYLYFISAGHMSVDMTSGALPAILPFLVAERGLTYTQVAGLMFALAFLSSILQPLFGYVSDKISKHWFMGAGIAMAGLAFSVIGFVENYWIVFVAISITGAGSSMFHPEAARLVNLISANHKGAGMATFSVGGNAGFAVGPILAVALVALFGLEGMVVFGILGFIMGIATIYLVPNIIKATKNFSSTSRPPTQVSKNFYNDWSAFRRLTVILIGRSTIFSGVMTFLPLYCITNLGVSNEAGSSMLSLYALMGIFMTILGGRLADTFDLVSVIRVCTIFYVPAIALILFAPNFAFMVALILPIAFATHGSYSPFVVLGQTYLAKSIGFASGVTLGLSTSMGGVISPILGYFADSFGIETAVYILVAVGFICTVASFTLPRPNRRA